MDVTPMFTLEWAGAKLDEKTGEDGIDWVTAVGFTPGELEGVLSSAKPRNKQSVEAWEAWMPDHLSPQQIDGIHDRWRRTAPGMRSGN